MWYILVRGISAFLTKLSTASSVDEYFVLDG